MYQTFTVSLVIPCKDEAKGLQSILPQVPEFIDEVLVVDNNSTDSTAEVAREFGCVVISEHNPGYGNAYKAGFTTATGQFIITMDGDCQYPTAAIEAMLQEAIKDKYSFVVGRRFPLQNNLAMSSSRKIGNWLLTKSLNLLFRVKLKDSQSGMWAFHKDILEKLMLQEPGMAFSQEIKLKAIQARLNYIEIHIPYSARQGQSKLSKLRDGAKNFWSLIRLRVNLGSLKNARNNLL